MHQAESLSPLHPRERKHRRFDLQLPVRLSFPSGGAVREIEAISRNVSMGGMLLKASAEVRPSTRVSLTMDVRAPRSRRLVRLGALGEIVRVEPLGPGAGFAIAIACDRPIAEMEEHLSPS